jgi:hypothetical protein
LITNCVFAQKSQRNNLHGDTQRNGGKKNECLILKKTIYGLIQSAKEFHKKLVLALKGFGFQGNSVDPCLWTKYTEHGIVFVGIYVDDCLVIGNEKDINDVINGLKTYKFGLKIANDLKDYLRYNLD